MKLRLLLAAALCVAAPSAFGSLTFTPTFTANFVADFGANAVAAENAWIAAANVYTADFSDNIHINITVDAVTGTAVFGESNTFLNSFTYAQIRTALVGDSKTANDAAALAAGGSVTSADPVAATHAWWVTTAEAKALGLIADNLSTDGTTTFGAGNPFSFSGTPASGFYDFQDVAAHEISEVMGRLGLSGGTIGTTANSYSLLDDFSFTGAGTRGLTPGPNENFSINDGTNLLKLYNNGAANGLDSRDWAPGTNDADNQFSNSGVINPVSAVDLEEMDVIGYDLAVPEPGTFALMAGGLLALGFARRRFATR